MSHGTLNNASGAHLRHALRTPLNHIIGYSEMMLEELADAGVSGDSELVSSLNAIVFNARELVRFVQNAIPPGGSEVRDADVRELQTWLQPHLLDLLGRVGAVESLVAGENAADVARVRFAAERLLAFSYGDQDALQDSTGFVQQSGGPVPGRREKARLLVVDDSPVNRDLLKRILERDGYELELAESGDAALQSLARSQFDLVLLDLVMPGKTGYELLEQLKNSSDCRNVPVITMSALDESSSVIRCMQLGAEDYFIKPFDPVLLRTRIEIALDRRRLRLALTKTKDQLSRLIASEKLSDEARSTLDAIRAEIPTI